MTNLTQQLKQGAGHALASLAQGWRELKERAGDALTRFQPNGEKSLRGGDSELPVAGRWGFMAADMVDSTNAVIVRLEAPGMSRSDFKLELRGQTLSIRGDKLIDQEFVDDGRHFMQAAYGSFRRDMELPAAVNPDKASATYRDGVLRVVLPKIQGANSRRLSVQVN